ncbi:MAG: recombinase family protein [Candidatus Pacearchaeota archaeon]|nr:recombinase family protein [Candidatus Pacearchaeota archaeon]
MQETLIYIRTSTEEQNPELQLNDCEALANKLGLKQYEIISDKQSAWKDNIEREFFDKVNQAIKNKQVKQLICWDLDRLYRNRKKLIAFFEFCKQYGCKVYSARQDWLESLNKIQEPFNEIMFDLMLQIMGWLAEEESSKKSMRVKNAVRRDTGITQSYKGNKWGRKSIQTARLKEEVLKLKEQGLSIRDIAKQVYYYDKNNNKKNPSPALICNLLKE